MKGVAGVWGVGAGALGLMALALVVLGTPDTPTLATLPSVALIFLGLHHHRSWSRSTRSCFLAFLGAVVFRYGFQTAEAMWGNFQILPEWDYLGFWLHARTAMLGLSFYDPENARQLASAFELSSEFTREIVDVGFWYPPPSMFLFWPLGWFDPMTALALWYVFHVAVLVADVVLLWRLFLPGGDTLDLAACAALVCVSYGTLETFTFAQTNFVALLLLLLFWRHRDSARGGLWAGAAFFVKPFLAVLALAPLLRGRWQTLGGLGISLVVLVLLSAWAFGPGTLGDYLALDQVGDKPDWIYDQPTNQSLLGIVLRASGTGCEGAACVRNPVFLGVSGVLGVITLGLGLGLRRRHDEWALALYLLCALIVYPVSQWYYSVLLIVPLLVAWRARERVAGGAMTVALLAAGIYALCAFQEGLVTGAATIVLWASMALFGVRLIQGVGWPLLPEPVAAASLSDHEHEHEHEKPLASRAIGLPESGVWMEIVVGVVLFAFYLASFRLASAVNGPLEIFTQDSFYILEALVAGDTYWWNPQSHLLYHALVDQGHVLWTRGFEPGLFSTYLYLKLFTALTGLGFVVAMAWLLRELGLEARQRCLLLVLAGVSVSAWFHFAAFETHCLAMPALVVYLISLLRLREREDRSLFDRLLLVGSLVVCGLTRVDLFRFAAVSVLLPLLPGTRRHRRSLVVDLVLAAVLGVGGSVWLSHAYLGVPLGEATTAVLERDDRDELEGQLGTLSNLTPANLLSVARAVSLYSVVMPIEARTRDRSFLAPPTYDLRIEYSGRGVRPSTGLFRMPARHLLGNALSLATLAGVAAGLLWALGGSVRRIATGDPLHILMAAQVLSGWLLYTWFNPAEPFLWILEFLPFWVVLLADQSRGRARPYWVGVALVAVALLLHNGFAFYLPFR